MFEYLQQIDSRIYDRYLTLEKNIKAASNSFYDSFLDLQENFLKYVSDENGISISPHESCGALLKRLEVRELFLGKYGLDSYTYDKMGDYAKKANEHKHRKEKAIEADTIVSYMHIFYDVSVCFAVFKRISVTQFDGKYFKSLFGSMEKVDEKLGVLSEGQQEILTTLQKLQNKPNNIAERIKEQEQKDKQDLIQFIKSAKRIFIYNGDKSSLDRLNKKRKKNYIERIIILFVLIVLSLSGITLSYGWIPIIPTVIICIPNLYYSFLHLKPSPYEFDYDSFNSNKWMRYDYDDNGIICGNDDKLIWKLSHIFLKVLTFVEAIVIMFVGIFNGVLLYLVIAGLNYILCLINIFVFRRIYMDYTLYFTDGDRKILYSQIKDFMTENGLK